MFEKQPVKVHLCCNDPDNGNFADRVWTIHIGENLELESKFWISFKQGPWGPRMRYITDANPGRPLIKAVAIAGRHFPVTYYKPWFGNWCWDLVHMPGCAVIELLNWPKMHKWFSPAEAEQRLFNLWESGGQWSDQDVRLLCKEFR
jgi:hypothetical protein